MSSVEFSSISIHHQEKWEKALEGFAYFASHTWHFNRAFQDPKIELIVAQSDTFAMVCPVTYRIQQWGKEVFSPLGYAGPIYKGTVQSIHEEWYSFWQHQEAVTGYIQLHPLLQQEQMHLIGKTTPEQTYPSVDSWIMNHNFIVSLDTSMKILQSNLAKDHRYRLKKWYADQNRISTASREAKIDAFVQLYQDFAQRRGLSSLYSFPESTLRLICENPNMEIIAAENPSGTIESVSLFPYGTNGAYYFLNGATESGQQHARAILWTAIAHFKEMGCNFVNLAGGIQTYDSLHSFKSRFGGTEYPTNALKQIYQPEKYISLCQQWDVLPEPTGYFPPWRKRC